MQVGGELSMSSIQPGHVSGKCIATGSSGDDSLVLQSPENWFLVHPLIFPSSPWAMDPPAVFNQEWPLLRDHLLELMLKPLSSTVVVTGIRSSSSVTWIFFPGSPSPGCSAWWQVCSRSERRGLESGDVSDLTAGRGAGVFSSIWYAPALSTEWNTWDQNSKKTSTSISSRH